MAKSILQNKQDKTCYLCNLLNGDDWPKVVEEHHAVGGNPGRKKSEHYGLKFYLCIPHHRTGKDAVHKNNEMNRLLKQIAQIAFEKKYSQELWMQEFGKNYIDDEIRERYLKK